MKNTTLRFGRLALVFCLAGACAGGLVESRVLAADGGALPPAYMLGASYQGVMAASQRPRPTLDEVVQGFQARDARVSEICQFLFVRDHLIVGLELIAPASEPDAVERPISGTFGPGPLRAILDAVVAFDPQFVWVEDDGVANLIRRANLADPSYTFNRTISAFDVEDTPFAETFLRFFGRKRDEVGGVGICGGLRHFPDQGPRVSVHMRGATARKILNEIAWQAGLAWRANFRPGDRMMAFVMTNFQFPTSQCLGCPGGSLSSPVMTTFAQASAGAEAPAAAESLVALREQLAPRGFGFIWDAAARRVSVVKARQRVTLAAGDTRATVNGVPVTLPAAPVLNDGRLLVPPVLVALAVGRGASGD
jgi:hypothetical protein